MTTWESIDKIDKIDTEDITVTSDEAFKRVTSDEGFIDEWKEWYLKQNTAWLIQEIPNIAFLDIADTMLEPTEEVREIDGVDVVVPIWSKTLYNKSNWVLRVGKAAKSIEAQPQDTVSLWLSEDKTYIISPGYTDNYVDFDAHGSSQNYTVCKPSMWEWALSNIETCKILQDWVYTISYWWTLETNSATWFKVIVWKLNWWVIAEDYFKGSLWEIMSWWKHTSNIWLSRGDYIYMKIQADDAIKMYEDTYIDIKFQQYYL